MLKYVKFKDLDESRKREYIEEVKRVLKRNGIDSDKFAISHVAIGDASEPFSEIHLENGIMLYDETHSPEWVRTENALALKAKNITLVNEPYSDYLGTGYVKKIRSMLTVDETLLPDRIVNADLNVGAMRQLIAPALEKMKMFGNEVDTEQKYNQLQSAALYYLAGILCGVLKSRTSAPPFNVKKYQKDWDKKRAGYMMKGNALLLGLRQMGGVGLVRNN